MKTLHFFLYKLPLILRVHRKRKNKLEIFAMGSQISNVNEIRQLVQALRQTTDRKSKTIFQVSGIFPRKVDSLILLGFEFTINTQNLNKIVRAIFEKIEILIFFFLCELPLILGVARKRKKKTGRRYLQGNPDIEFEQDWSVGLGATLRDRQKIKNYFSSFKNFSGKSRWCHIVEL